MIEGIYVAPHPFDDTCTCDRCTDRRNMLGATLEQQRLIEEAKKAQKQQPTQEVKMSRLRAKLAPKPIIEESDDSPINFDVTLDDDIAAWFDSLCKEFNKEPNEMFNTILRCQMEEDIEQ